MMDSNDDNNGAKQLSSSNDSFLQDILSIDVKEPTNGNNGARVQIRMPGGGKLVKKFDGDDPVKVIYAFVAVSYILCYKPESYDGALCLKTIVV